MLTQAFDQGAACNKKTVGRLLRNVRNWKISFQQHRFAKAEGVLFGVLDTPSSRTRSQNAAKHNPLPPNGRLYPGGIEKEQKFSSALFYGKAKTGTLKIPVF